MNLKDQSSLYANELRFIGGKNGLATQQKDNRLHQNMWRQETNDMQKHCRKNDC